MTAVVITVRPSTTDSVEAQSPGAAEPNVVRILSRENDNQVYFEPASVHDSINLSANEYVEIVTEERGVPRRGSIVLTRKAGSSGGPG